MTNLKRTIINEMVEDLRDYEGAQVADYPFERYNTDYYIIGTYEAKQFVREHLDDVLYALERYHTEYGTQYPYITDVEKLVSLTVLILAEEIWFGLDTVAQYYDDELNSDIITEIVEELKGLI